MQHILFLRFRKLHAYHLLDYRKLIAQDGNGRLPCEQIISAIRYTLQDLLYHQVKGKWISLLQTPQESFHKTPNQMGDLFLT